MRRKISRTMYLRTYIERNIFLKVIRICWCTDKSVWKHLFGLSRYRDGKSLNPIRIKCSLKYIINKNVSKISELLKALLVIRNEGLCFKSCSHHPLTINNFNTFTINNNKLLLLLAYKIQRHCLFFWNTQHILNELLFCKYFQSNVPCTRNI